MYFWGEDAIAKYWTSVEDAVNSFIESCIVFLRIIFYWSGTHCEWPMCIKIVVYFIGASAFTKKVFIDFVWQGRHWTKSDILYLHKSYGSLGLVNIVSILHAFRQRFIQ